MKKSNVVVLPTPARKRSFTSAEELIEEVRTEIYRSGMKYRDIAEKVGVSKSTVYSLASGKTRWPRPTTLFPLLDSMKLELRLMKKRSDG